MADHTSRLPDEVIGYILSFLTVRDAVRAKLSSSRWLHLPNFRSVIQFDKPNVLGNQEFWINGPSPKSMFVEIVNRYLELSMGNRISKLTVQFWLGNEDALHIDRWIASSIAMEVEEIEIHLGNIRDERYVFPCHLLYSGKAPYLRRLSLALCKIRLSSQCTSWLSNLTALRLTYVPLHESDWQHILCAGSNLISMELSRCSLRGTLFINGQLLRLKKFSFYDDGLDAIKLNCPNLEEFEYYGRGCDWYFVHVPKLREASVWYPHDGNGLSSKLFSSVSRNVPQLQALSLRITSEVQLYCATLASLKRLNIEALIPIGFNILTITDMLNASPFLETLQIQLDTHYYYKNSQRKEYPDCRHFHLKEVKIKGSVEQQQNEMELAMYILRNAVALEQMVIELPKWASEAEQKATTLLLMQTKINPTAEVIILWPNPNEDKTCST